MFKFKKRKKNKLSLENPIKTNNDNGIRVSILVNLSNYENIRITSSRYDDVEKCLQELEDALNRIPTSEAKEFIDSYLTNRDYKYKLGVFKASHPNY